jgi:hypothetical protein
MTQAETNKITDEVKMDKINAVLISCLNWEQLMLTYEWICKIIKNQSIKDELFTTCIRLNNQKGFGKHTPHTSLSKKIFNHRKNVIQ